MRLLTLNTLFKGDVGPRLRALGAILDREPYDVVCLQEVLTPGGARLLSRLAPAYAHRRYDGILTLKGGLVLLSRVPITRCRFVRFPVTRPLRPELLMRKGAQVAVLETAAGPLAVVNTHLSANRDDDWSPENRWSALARGELAHLAGVLAGLDPALPVVVTGDLNVPRDSAVLAGFLGAAGLADAMAGDPRPTYRPTPQWPRPPAFDHVLVRSVTASCRLVFEEETVPLPGGRTAYLSDHYGVEADLTLP